jgi:hypothetical protein
MVLFGNRSLENVVHISRLPLQTASDASARAAASQVPPHQAARVASVVAEWSNLDEYFPKTTREGGRETHYRSPHVECTLVAFIPHTARAWHEAIDEFQRAIEARLSDHFVFFNPLSRHITIRAM